MKFFKGTKIFCPTTAVFTREKMPHMFLKLLPRLKPWDPDFWLIDFFFWLLFHSNVCSSFLIENKYAPCISDNTDLRVILSILYSILEVIRCYDIEVTAKRFQTCPEQDEKFKKFKTHLTSELSNKNILNLTLKPRVYGKIKLNNLNVKKNR